MDLDIIIYAVIAFILLARLWTVLGRRNDDEPQRPNPFITPIIHAKNGTDQPTPPTIDQTPRLLSVVKIPPASLEGGLQQIKEKIADFDEKKFLQLARSNFVLIIEDFAKGDLTRIDRLLSPPVLDHFKNALEGRRNAGQTMESHIVDVKDVETVTAKLDGNNAFITVRFVTHQQNILRDRNGQIIGGDPNKFEELTDQWGFSRDVTSTDTNWYLAETGA